MALHFDSPGQLERRIAAQMAADDSYDSTLGISRKAASLASMSSFATDEESFERQSTSRTMGSGVEERSGSAFAASRMARETSAGRHSPMGGQSSGTQSSSANTLAQTKSRRDTYEYTQSSTTSVLGERDTNVPTQRATLAGALNGSLKSSTTQASTSSTTTKKARPPSASFSSQASSSDMRVRSPPLTSTPRSESNASEREKQEGVDEEKENRQDMSFDRSAMDPLRDSDLPETSSYFRSRVLGERFEASVAGDESLSAAIIGRRPERMLGSSSNRREEGGRQSLAVSRSSPLKSSSALTRQVEPRASDTNGGVSKANPTAFTVLNQTPKASNAQQERMKAYVLNSVRATNPLRQAQLRNMTPKARRTSGKNVTLNVNATPFRLDGTPYSADASVAPSVTSETSSTNDLTMPATLAMRANTSLPGIGALEMGSAGDVRVDPHRLQAHLAKMNDQLGKENEALYTEKEELQSKFDRALLDNEKLRKQLEQAQQASARRISTTPVGSPMTQGSSANVLTEQVDALQSELLAKEEELARAGDQEVKLCKHVEELEKAVQQERDARHDDEEHYQIEIQTGSDERDRLKRQLDEERASAAMRIRDAEMRLVGDTTPSNDANEVIASLREELQQSEQELQFHEQQAADMKQEIDELKVQLHEADSIRADRDALDQEFNDLAAECDDLRDALGEANNKISDLEIALTERENEKLTLELKLSHSKDSSELKQLKEKVLLLETTLAMTRTMAAKEGMRTLNDVEGSSLSHQTNASTPLHRNVAHLRVAAADTPRSPPVVELSNASWMQSQATLGEAALRRDLSALKHEHDAVRSDVDRRIQELGEQGLFKKLNEAQEAVQRMEFEVKAVQLREERQLRRLMRLRCGTCKERVSLPDDFEKTLDASVSTQSIFGRSVRAGNEQAEVMRLVKKQVDELQVNWDRDLEKLQEDRRKFEAEKQNLRLAHQEHVKRQAKMNDVARGQHAATLNELSRARRLVREYQREHQQDCEMIEQAMRKSQHVDREADGLQAEIRRTRNQVAQIESELNVKKATFERLERELMERSHVNVSTAGDVHSLNHDVARFSAEIERLREERNVVLRERQTLFNRKKEMQQQCNNANGELQSAREALFAHQRQLDEQVNTIEGLHAKMAEQDEAFAQVCSDRDQLREHRREIFRHVGHLEEDLRRVRDESRRFGDDLDGFRRQQQRTHAVVQKSSSHGVDRAEVMKELAKREQEAAERHKMECRGLLMQIRYEKAKYVRESDLRADLIHQKQYLLGIVGGLRMCDAETTRFLANLSLSRGHVKSGKSGNVPVRRQFKAAVLAVVAVQRAERMANNWRSSKEVKQALRQAHTANKKARASQESNQLNDGDAVRT